MTKDKKRKNPDDKELKNEQPEANESSEADNAEAEVKSEAETYLDNWKRAQADFINYKRRSELEKEDTIKFGNTVLIRELLPVLDDLQRALGSIPQEISDIPWVEGIRLIERKFNKSLESQGVKEIKTEGEAFDPNVHEAVLHVDGADGMVVKELQKGYKLYDRVIRPAMVTVGNGK
ncbi:MAG: nucleotide exchange factor GrpE [Dehalococcoidales bacterium]|nr:nucleotide exchange factor GrpE [Dehalococcoidales bacterium]